MRRVAMHFPVLVYPSESAGMRRYTAHCLNLDVLADDDTVEGALSLLVEVIEQHLTAAEEYGADPFQRAPDRYWDMLGRARRLPDAVVEQAVRDANQRLGVESGSSAIDAVQLEIREVIEAAA